MLRADDMPRGPSRGQRGLRQCILFVEEACDLRQLNAEVLTDAGYHVDVAEDAVTAWNALQLYRYDLLITEQFLPEFTAVELIMKIDAANLTLPVIIVAKSLSASEPAPHSCPQSVTTLHKPYPIENLLGLVKNVLKGNPIVRSNNASLTSRQTI